MKKIYVVGAGGKTSWIDWLARTEEAKGKFVVILTTTHRMLPQKDAIFVENGEEERALELLRSRFEMAMAKGKGCIVEVGSVVMDKEGNPRMGYLGDRVFQAVSSMADVVLVEADGAKRLPVKVPAMHEPVIFEPADTIFVVQGLSAIGKEGDRICHRWEIAKTLLKGVLLPEDSEKEQDLTLTSEMIGLFMKKGYLEPLRRQFPNANVIPVLNQADTEEMREIAKQLLYDMGEDVGVIACLREGIVESTVKDIMKDIVKDSVRGLS